MISKRMIVALLLGSFALARSAAAAESGGLCPGTITPGNVVSCALTASLPSRVEREGARAAEGRVTAATPFLPTNPVLSMTGSRHVMATTSVFNWSAALSQEIEIAGQRGARIDAASEQLAAQRKRVVATDRDVASSALVAYYDLVAAEQGVRLAARLDAISRAVAVAARARADRGLAPPVDADVAQAAGTRVAGAKAAADEQLRMARATLASLLGRAVEDPIVVQGDLAPPLGLEEKARALAARAAESRPDVQALEAERRAFDARASMFRRARVPNPTLSVFAQNDDLNDRIFGIALSIPLPLPQPVGRTYAGEIAEAEALSSRSAADAERLRREVRLQVATARDAYEAKAAALAAYSPDQLSRAEQSLQTIAQEIEAGRVAVRDAVVAQASLIELLQRHLELRRELCVAAVELARAAGVPLENNASL